MPVEIEPIRDDFGAQVYGVDLNRDLDPETFRAVYDGLIRHGLLIFRGLDLPPERQIAFARRFNRIRIYIGNDDTKMPGYPEINRLGNATDENGKPIAFLNKAGIEWHTDGTGFQYPPVSTVLYCVEAPSRGGETLYASGKRAWDDLSAEQKARFAPLRVRYSYSSLYKKLTTNSDADKTDLTENEKARAPEVVHPLVRTHSATGNKALWFTQAEMACFEGMSEEDSTVLGEEIVGIISRPDYVYAHAWRPGDLLIWDNRQMHHSTTPFTYENEIRLMHRISGEGDEIPH
jgi:taurine dioxygenase